MVKAQAIAMLTAASSVVAYPHLAGMEDALRDLQKRDVDPPYRAPNFIIDRPNTGLPPLGFNAADQYVDVTDSGPHPFRAPGANDKRGECPGLNAAANHGFLPRNGIPTIAQSTIWPSRLSSPRMLTLNSHYRSRCCVQHGTRSRLGFSGCSRRTHWRSSCPIVVDWRQLHPDTTSDYCRWYHQRSQQAGR